MTLLFLSAQELIPIIILIVLIFGGKKIPELMRGLGSGVKEFKEASKEDTKEEKKKEEETKEDK